MKGVLVPDPNNGVVDVFINGLTVSDTVAVAARPGLLIYSTSYIPFVLPLKRVYVNESGVRMPSPPRPAPSASSKLRR